MRVRRVQIPVDSLANQYLPVDYYDAFACELIGERAITADEIQIQTWGYMPRWLSILMKIRNAMVRPFGLKGSSEIIHHDEIQRLIQDGVGTELMSLVAKNNKETLLLLSDKHLNAYCSAYVDTKDSRQIVTFSTLVRFHNSLGKVYFFFIKPFHKIVIKNMLKTALRILTK